MEMLSFFVSEYTTFNEVGTFAFSPEKDENSRNRMYPKVTELARKTKHAPFLLPHYK